MEVNKQSSVKTPRSTKNRIYNSSTKTQRKIPSIQWKTVKREWRTLTHYSSHFTCQASYINYTTRLQTHSLDVNF